MNKSSKHEGIVFAKISNYPRANISAESNDEYYSELADLSELSRLGKSTRCDCKGSCYTCTNILLCLTTPTRQDHREVPFSRQWKEYLGCQYN